MDMTFKDELIERIVNKNAQIGIIGLGYVGLPLLLCCCDSGFRVLGFDRDIKKINSLAEGKSYIDLIPHESISSCKNQFEATNDFSKALEVDVLILCLPTPLNKFREPDLSCITETMDSLLPYLRAGQMICLESTTYPGTTDEELATRITSRGFSLGEDFFLVYSPEREDPGNCEFKTRTIPKVCGGYTKNCLEIAINFYGKIVDEVVPVSSTRMAELTKILENIHRAVNIGLVNEMKIIADKMGLDIHEAIKAASTKPFGFVPYQPGPGLGGHCIPIDPFYLTWKAREYGVHTRFIELAGEVNASMPDYVISKVISALNAHKKAVNESKILLLGIAYKKNVDDMRESPSLVIMQKIHALGAIVAYSDPFIPSFAPKKDYHLELSSVPINSEIIKSYDCIILATDHDKFDYELILENAQLIIDCRGRYLEKNAKVFKA
jgi:UDP-N-acetyl-D-glucosamine dehydrogenase